MKESITTALAFDFGLKRIGVAVGQKVTQSASALTTLHSRSGSIDWSGLTKIIEEWQPDVLILGSPGTAQDAESSIENAIKDFGKELETRFQLPVVSVDEILTSREATARLNEQRRSGTKKRRIRKGDIDSLSAQLIMETWLNTQR